MLAASLLKRVFRVGTLNVIDATGRKHVFSGREGPSCTIRLHDRSLHHRLLTNPQLSVGEGYMDGTLTLEDCSLHEFLELCGRNIKFFENLPDTRFASRFRRLLRAIHQFNPVAQARIHAAHHYDLSGALYDLFLDKDRQYSCAYFTTDNDTLEVAQDNKKRHIAAKLLLRSGDRVLDIGSGWGGLGLYLARVADVSVTGITLSFEQHKVSQERAAEAKLGDRVAFALRDYREQKGRFERIVSVGMFEHVGARYYQAFFEQVKRLLTEDGVCLLHSIGRMEPPGSTNPWLRNYIFPGGYAPALSEVLAAVEKVGLWVTDIEILRLHYAETLKEWTRRFYENRESVRDLYDERFCRMWEFYLVGCELAFRHFEQMVFQMQLARRQDAVPLTREYVTDWERTHAATANLAR